MTCHVCDRDGEARVCDSCRNRVTGALYELPPLNRLAGATLAPSGKPGERVSGSRSGAPLPVRLDALNLRGPAAPQVVLDPYGDQHGPTPILAVLRTWEEDWRYWRALAPRDASDALDPVDAAAMFLVRHLGWACDHHPAIGDFADEITRLCRTARAVAGMSQLVHHLPAPCPDPDCDTLALVRRDGSNYVECRACGAAWSEIQYRRLCIVLAAENSAEGPTR